MSMDGEPGLKARRASSFGEVAEQYDAVRPTYPAQLVDDIAALIPGGRVAEVGAGTGIATRLLAERGLRVTAIEPDAQMAAVLTRRQPGVDVVHARFESWRPSGAYDALVAFQSWHWTQADGRTERAAAALRSGGVIALAWNLLSFTDPRLRAAVDAVYDSHGVSEAARPIDDLEPASVRGWPATELASSALFTDVEARTYDWTEQVGASALMAFLATTSHHRVMLGSDRSHRLAGDLRRVFASSGQAVSVARQTHLFLARRQPPGQ